MSNSLHGVQNNLRVGTGGDTRPYEIHLTPIGEVVQQTIEFIDENYENIKIDNFCIMPDSVHLFISITQESIRLSDGQGRPSLRNADPAQQKMNLESVLRQLKTFTAKRAKGITGNQKYLLWQTGFYDCIIRNDEDYAEKWRYMDENPLKYIIKSEE